MLPLRTVTSLLSLSAMLCGPAAARADVAAPDWSVNAICSGSAKSDCLRVENRNRYSVLNRWAGFPADDRAACLTGDQSYERLLNCLDDRAMKAMEASPSNPSGGGDHKG